MKPYIFFIRKFNPPYFLVLALSILLVGCEDFLEPDTPLGQISQQDVFNDENTATAAVTTLYGKLRDAGFLSGSLSGTGFTMGLYADELDYYFFPGFAIESFYLHQISPSNTSLKSVWDVPYNIVYDANLVLEGLETSDALSTDIKEQLRGEALFVRAICHFYLMNSFGDIPYITNTDYSQNSKVSRLPTVQVYENIIADLLEAKTLMSDDYLNTERVRPNSFVTSALLARVYLYMGDWSNAELESSRVINNTSYFSMGSDINNVFLKEGLSTIWQFKPKYEGENTLEGANYIFTSGPPPLTALNPTLVEEMEIGDLRRLNWVGEVSDGSKTWYYAFKYKENSNTGSSLEYSKVFRLAEQYLIRSEARAELADIFGSQQDLNEVRNRAGLQNTQAGTSKELKEAVLNERRFELFTEFGHRWFDLRRYGEAAEVLSPIKPGWRSTDILLPIPEAELLLNPNLNPQNPGY